MPEELVDLDQLKAHLRITGTAEDDDLQLKLEIAQELVINYVDQRRDDDDAEAWALEVEAWTPDTAPKMVLAAILVQAAELYRFRGDDPPADKDKRGLGELSPSVTALLYRLRDPAVS